MDGRSERKPRSPARRWAKPPGDFLIRDSDDTIPVRDRSPSASSLRRKIPWRSFRILSPLRPAGFPLRLRCAADGESSGADDRKKGPRVEIPYVFIRGSRSSFGGHRRPTSDKLRNFCRTVKYGGRFSGRPGRLVGSPIFRILVCDVSPAPAERTGGVPPHDSKK